MNLRHNKRSGFTLMEIMISLAIVAILIATTLPIINKQLEKADEYSYYLAYKTVEKMAGQIAAIGDPTELTDSGSIIIADAEDTSLLDKISERLNFNKAKKFIASIGNKLAKSEVYIFKSIFPRAFAVTKTFEEDVYSWDSDSYDMIWLAYRVCGGAQIPKQKETITNEDGTTEERTIYYTRNDSEFNNCKGYTEGAQDSAAPANKYITELLYPEGSPCYSSNVSKVVEKLKNTEKPDAKSICTSIFTSSCPSSKFLPDIQREAKYIVDYRSSGEDVEDGTAEDNEGSPDDIGSYLQPPMSDVAGECILKSSYTLEMGTESASITASARPSFSDSDCSSGKGYYNMKNEGKPSTISCVCSSGTIPSENYDNVCCTPCSQEGALPYSTGSSSTCVCCVNDYNKITNTCCPDNSVYVEGEGCQCIEGYKMQDGKCVESECTAGSTMVDGVCVVNPPITKASRLCEQIEQYWNIDEDKTYCTAFTEQNGISYNKPVYEALLGQNGNLMSIKSNIGAFGLKDDGSDKIKPNIVFSNGLKLWIVSDKTASIPGLSFTTENSTPSRNVCRNLKKSTHISCYNAGGYFCKSEKNCFALDAESKAEMGDARNCCGSVDISDIAAASQVTADPDGYLKNTQAYAISGFTVLVDINGDKGNGTLWDDVYPFFIASNGVVYPAYPLDAPKNTGANTALYLGGNSAKQLAVDVYYYESTDASRERKVAFPGVSFARGVCSARQVSKYTPYCLNLGESFAAKGLDNRVLTGSNYIKYDDVNASGSEKSYNPCDKYKCFVSVRRKLRTF